MTGRTTPSVLRHPPSRPQRPFRVDGAPQPTRRVAGPVVVAQRKWRPLEERRRVSPQVLIIINLTLATATETPRGVTCWAWLHALPGRNALVTLKCRDRRNHFSRKGLRHGIHNGRLWHTLCFGTSCVKGSTRRSIGGLLNRSQRRCRSLAISLAGQLEDPTSNQQSLTLRLAAGSTPPLWLRKSGTRNSSESNRDAIPWSHILLS